MKKNLLNHLLTIFCLFFIFKTQAQAPCDILQTGTSITPGTIHVGQTAVFGGLIYNNSQPNGCEYATGTVRVEFSLPVGGEYIFDGIVEPLNGIGLVFDFVYDPIENVVVGVNKIPIKDGKGDTFKVRVKGMKAVTTTQIAYNIQVEPTQTNQSTFNDVSTASLHIIKMVVNLEPVQILCGSQVGSVKILAPTGGTAPFTVSGPGISGSVAVNAADFPYTVSNVAAGTHVYTVIDNLGNSNTGQTIINPAPVVPTASISKNPNVSVLTCTNPSTVLMASGGISYLWNNASASASITASSAGTFGVTVTAANGCTASTSVTLTEDKTAPTCTLPANKSVCPGTLENITGPAGMSQYAWNGATFSGVTNSANAFIQTGATCGLVYNPVLTITAANGCTSSCTTQITTADNVAPTITCPKTVIYENLLVNQKSNDCAYTIKTTDFAGLVVSDNCTASANIVLTYFTKKAGAVAFSASANIIAESFPAGVSSIKIVASDACNNTSSCSFSVIVRCKTDVICTNWSEDFGGDISNGPFPQCGSISEAPSPAVGMLNALNGVDAVFGSATNKFIFKVSDITSGNANTLLFGANGTPAALAAGTATYDVNATWPQVPLNPGPATATNPVGMINNPLLTRAIALFINLQNSASLDNVVITNNMWTQAVDCATGTPIASSTVLTQIPNAVVSYLFNPANGYTQNVLGLFNLANDLLGGKNIGTPGLTIPTLAEVTQAMAEINGAFRGCRVLLVADINILGIIYNDADGLSDGIIDGSPGSVFNGIQTDPVTNAVILDGSGNPIPKYFLTLIEGNNVNLVTGENMGKIINVISIDQFGQYNLVPVVNGQYSIIFGDNPAGNRKPVVPVGKVFAGEGGRLSTLADFPGFPAKVGYAIGDGSPNGKIVVTVTAGSLPTYANAKKAKTNETLPPMNFALGNTALPVRLSTFEGKKTSLGNEINWTISSQSNFSHFELQKSDNNREFLNLSKIAFSVAPKYQFIDKAVNEKLGINYYRLKMIDLDGYFEYSKIISVKNDKGVSQIGQFYPNPLANNGQTYIEINSAQSGSWTVNQFAIDGKLVQQSSHQLQAGKNKITVFAPQKPGVYIVNIENGQEKHIRKLVKQ